MADVLRTEEADQQIEDAYTALMPAIKSQSAALVSRVGAALAERPEEPWTAPVARMADGLVATGRVERPGRRRK